jgi:hypothetical protein
LHSSKRVLFDIIEFMALLPWKDIWKWAFVWPIRIWN